MSEEKKQEKKQKEMAKRNNSKKFHESEKALERGSMKEVTEPFSVG